MFPSSPIFRALAATLGLLAAATLTLAADPSAQTPQQIFARVRAHQFHPIRDGFTFDRHLNKHGVASLDDQDWRIRTLAIRDLVRLGPAATNALIQALDDPGEHLRHVAALTLGILKVTNAVASLQTRLARDTDPVVRSQAAIALGQIGHLEALASLQSARQDDPSRDVRHQASLAAYALEHGKSATPELAAAWAALDESAFDQLQPGQPAPDFQLPDTNGKTWRLSDFRGRQPVLLIWVFADWCPVCHGEFRELIQLRQQFKDTGAQVFTLECHDLYPARVMVGQELEPEYWFSKKSFKESYTQNIWWPHLVDRAGAVGATFGVQPMSFVVHSEWINRPSAILIDQEGLVRFAYYGTYWGDRPTIHQLLEMLRTQDYTFDPPSRLKPATKE